MSPPGSENLKQRAMAMAYVRPIGLYPGWHFGVDWDRPEADYQARLEVWQACHDHGEPVSIEFRWYDGLRLNLILRSDQSRILFIGGTCDPNEFAFLDRFLKPGMVVIDAGANLGLYTLFAAHRVGPTGRLFSFEPSERDFERLERNIALNGFGNVQTVRMALTDQDGEADLHVASDDYDGHNTFGSFMYSEVTLLRTERVIQGQLDTYLRNQGLSRVHLLKMDIEGGEVRLLHGARQTIAQSRPVILLEASEEALRRQGSGRDQLLEMLTEMGYVMYGFGPDGRPVRSTDLEGLNLIATPREAELPEEWCGTLSVPLAKCFKPAVAYWNQRQRLAASRARIQELRAAVDQPRDLLPFQFAQLMSVGLEFKPDVIIELGRFKGNSTCAFVEASNQSSQSIRVVSVCNSEEWQKTTVPRLRSAVPENWFQPLEAHRADILSFDYASAVNGAKRVMLFWDAHGFEIAEFVLGEILPLIASKDHLVLMHDLSDTRYQSREQLAYGSNGLWRSNDWDGRRVKIGIVDSAVEQSIAALDFTTRNRLTFDSADHSFHTEFTPQQKQEMESVLGDLFDTQGHWFYFTLNEHGGPYTFPRFTRSEKGGGKSWWRLR
jgi:FkbM family methyltransferase